MSKEAIMAECDENLLDSEEVRVFSESGGATFSESGGSVVDSVGNMITNPYLNCTTYGTIERLIQIGVAFGFVLFCHNSRNRAKTPIGCAPRQCQLENR